MNTQYLDWIRAESDAFVAAIDANALGRVVPSCPDWTLRDLVAHLGRVQRFWASTVRAGADVDPTAPDPSRRPPDDADADALQTWMRASTNELLDALDATPADTPAWTWWLEKRTAGAIARHQVQEAAVHRWDAQSVTGTAQPLATALADDGVEEFMWIARQLREPSSVALRCTDTGRVVRMGPEPSAVTVSGSASELVLLLYGRVDTGAVDVDGDRDTLDAFLMPIA